MTATPKPIVEIRDLTKSYRRGSQVLPVLEHIDLDIPEGEFLALMGPSGSGKSTLLNLIAGIDKPDSGVLRVGGVDISTLSRGGAGPLAGRPRRLHLPVLQPDAGAHRLRKRGAAPAAHPSLAPGAPRARGDGPASGQPLPTGWTTTPPSSPAASSSGWPSPAPSSPTRRILVADEPTGDLDRESAEEVLGLMDRLNREFGKTIDHGDPRSRGQPRRPGSCGTWRRGCSTMLAFLSSSSETPSGTGCAPC